MEPETFLIWPGTEMQDILFAIVDVKIQMRVWIV